MSTDGRFNNEKLTVPERLEIAAKTFVERNKIYGDNYKTHGNVMLALFPDGITLLTSEDFARYGLLNSIVMKLHRYTTSFKHKHKDSIHDMGIYAFMLEAVDHE